MPHLLRCPLVLPLCLGLFVAGCGKPVAPSIQPAPPVVELPPPVPPPPPSVEAPPPAPSAPTDDELFARKSLAELNAERPLGVVYFDCDQSDLREEARGVLARNADWLRRWPATRITIEGHCDERGTAEYNIALGDRRAEAARGYLLSLGIAGDRVQAVSKGKEAPLCTDALEACWHQNRRGFPIITAK